jgi:hypothetical protein
MVSIRCPSQGLQCIFYTVFRFFRGKHSHIASETDLDDDTVCDLFCTIPPISDRLRSETPVRGSEEAARESQ